MFKNPKPTQTALLVYSLHFLLTLLQAAANMVEKECKFIGRVANLELKWKVYDYSISELKVHNCYPNWLSEAYIG